MKRLLALLLFATLAGCGGQTPIVPGTLGDRDPVDWGGRPPQALAVHGIDVARFQESVDWRSARAAGISFAFVKATEGGDLLDPKFAEHWREAGRAGVLRGAYHFYYFCTDAATQARWFIENVPRERGALPPVLDMEWNPFSPTCAHLRPPGATVRAEMLIFLSMLERHYGQRPIIYTTPGFYRDAGLDQMRNEEFWLRSTAAHPDDKYPRQPWAFWQYTATGILPGTDGDIDLNAFRGGAEAWRAWLSRRRQ